MMVFGFILSRPIMILLRYIRSCFIRLRYFHERRTALTLLSVQIYLCVPLILIAHLSITLADFMRPFRNAYRKGFIDEIDYMILAYV